MRFTFVRQGEALAREWPRLNALFEALPLSERSEYTLDQLRVMAESDRVQVAKIEDDAGGLLMALALEHIDYPAYSAVNILAMAGDRPGRAAWQFGLEAIKEFARRTHAMVVQALCGDGIARLLARHGFEKAYNQVRISL